VIGCILTERPDNGIKITGFPENMLDEYLPKVIRAGYPVAMCEL
jgi:DNA mismatch repair ATPase MutS